MRCQQLHDATNRILSIVNMTSQFTKVNFSSTDTATELQLPFTQGHGTASARSLGVGSRNPDLTRTLIPSSKLAQPKPNPILTPRRLRQRVMSRAATCIGISFKSFKSNLYYTRGITPKACNEWWGSYPQPSSEKTKQKRRSGGEQLATCVKLDLPGNRTLDLPHTQ